MIFPDYKPPTALPIKLIPITYNVISNINIKSPHLDYYQKQQFYSGGVWKS